MPVFHFHLVFHLLLEKVGQSSWDHFKNISDQGRLYLLVGWGVSVQWRVLIYLQKICFFVLIQDYIITQKLKTRWRVIFLTLRIRIFQSWQCTYYGFYNNFFHLSHQICEVFKAFECRSQGPFMAFSLMMIKVFFKLIDRVVGQMRKGICQVVCFGFFKFSIIQKNYFKWQTAKFLHCKEKLSVVWPTLLRHKFSCQILAHQLGKDFEGILAQPCFMIYQFYSDCRSEKCLYLGSWLRVWECKFCLCCVFSWFYDDLLGWAMFLGKSHNPTYEHAYFGEVNFHIVKVGGESIFSSDLWDVRKVIDSLRVLKRSDFLDGEKLIGPKESKMINSKLKLKLINSDFLNDGILGCWVRERLK